MELFQERKYDAVNGKIVNRATGEPIPDEEPIFIIRAKDQKAIGTLEFYRFLCKEGLHAEVIEGRIDDFKQFQKKHPELVREPDSDRSCRKLTDWIHPN